MKVLHVSSYDLLGGAARAAYRVHKGLQSAGLESHMLVQTKLSRDKSVLCPSGNLDSNVAKLRPAINKIPLLRYQNRDEGDFSPQWFPEKVAAKVKRINPDVINLNWICDGYVRIETLAQLNRPIVWTLMDMWAFTGGCHYSKQCNFYKKSCGACPQLESKTEKDMSRTVWKRKEKAWKSLNMTVISPSQWLANCAKESSLFRNSDIRVIPYGLDIESYKPIHKHTARSILTLPQDKKLILFGAISATTDSRKGWSLLVQSLKLLHQLGWSKNAELIVFGSSESAETVDLGFNVHFLGHLSDDISLRLAYSAADVMVVPSLQEAFGQTASESFACGTPVVAFNATGLKDIVNHQLNGYLAQPYSTRDLAEGIIWTLENCKRWQGLSKSAREKACKRFSQETQAARYKELFEEICPN